MSRGKFITKAEMLRIWNLHYQCNMKNEYIALQMNISPMTVYRAVTIMTAASKGENVDFIFGQGNNLGMKHFAKEIFPTKTKTVTLTQEQLDKISCNLAKLYQILKESSEYIEKLRLLLK